MPLEPTGKADGFLLPSPAQAKLHGQLAPATLGYCFTQRLRRANEAAYDLLVAEDGWVLAQGVQQCGTQTHAVAPLR